MPKKKQAMSMSELKRALVNKRLAMLHDDDDDDDDHHHIHAESGGISSYYRSRKLSVTSASHDVPNKDGKLQRTVQPTKKQSHKQSVVVTDDEQKVDRRFNLSVQPTKIESCKQSVVVSDAQKEDGKIQLLIELAKKSSRKRSVVVSDDESEEDGKPTMKKRRSVVISDDEAEEDRNLQVLVQQPTEEERKTKRKRISSARFSNNDTHNALDTPRNKRVETAEPTDASSSLSSAMKRAVEVQANLPKEHPSFVKLMLPSHVSRVFWLHIPSKFCRVHLPKCDSMIDLIDEDGKKFECIFHKSALSGGWRGFSLDHELSEGDIVVFQLIDITAFKVFIVRKNGQDKFQGALGLLTLDDCREKEVSSEKGDEQIPTVSVLENIPPRNSESPSISSDNNIECEVLDGICFSDSTVNFETIKSFENFRIVVDGLVVDSKFSDTNRQKYYELCCSQKSFLHEHLLKGLNCNLVIGMIMEIIKIADGLRACTSSTSIKDLQRWEKALKGFELIGMKVGFLRGKLITLQKCIDERDCVARKMADLENKLEKLKSMMEKVNSEIECEIETSAQKLQSKLQEIANAPW